MKNHYPSTLFFLSVIFLLAACSPSANPTEVDVNPYLTALAMLPSPTVLLPTATLPPPTSTFTASPTIPPTASPLPTDTPSPTQPASIFQRQPTQNLTAVAIMTAIPPTQTMNMSPDRKWQAILSSSRQPVPSEAGLPYWTQTLKLVNMPTKKQTLLEQQVYNSGGVGMYGLKVLFWSANSRYLYYTTEAWGAPDGMATRDRSIIRVSVADGITTMFSQGPISPKGNRMAFREWDKLTIVDLESGGMAPVTGIIPGAPISAIAWTPDSNVVVYAQSNYDLANPSLQEKTYLVALDLKTMTQATLLESADFHFTLSGSGLVWQAADVLLINAIEGTWAYYPKTKVLKVTRQ